MHKYSPHISCFSTCLCNGVKIPKDFCMSFIIYLSPRLVPVPILGFEQLQSRMKFQQQETALHKNALEVKFKFYVYFFAHKLG